MKTPTCGTLKYEGQAWTVQSQPHVLIRLKRVFPKVQDTDKWIAISDTPENARDLLWFLQRYPMEIEPGHAKELFNRAQQHREQESLIDRMVRGVEPPRKFNLAKPPRDYQQFAADLCLRSGALLCADDVGLGKTVTGICVLTDPDARPALVVTLAHLPKQWAEAIEEFAPNLTTHILAGTEPYDITANRFLKKSGRLRNPNQFPDVVICNYHKLNRAWARTLAPIIKTVIFDEAQELRRSESLKYEAAKHVAGAAKFRAGLTATPIYNYGPEMFNILNVIAPGQLGSRREFALEWCRGFTGDKTPIENPKAFGTYLRSIGLMVRRTREDVGRALPGLYTTPQFIDCDREVLDKVKSPAAELARIILSQNSRARAEKMQAAERLSNLVRQATGIAKAPYAAAFTRMLIESGKSVVLYGWHREVYSIWLEHLKDFNPLMFTGSESPKQKQDAKAAFIAGESPLLIISLRAGAGIDGLQKVCHNVVIGELDWSPAVHEQCFGRLYRDGQPEPVMGYFLIATDGADPIMADVLGVKQAQAHGVRDPNAELIAELQLEGDHIKKLASAYLAKEHNP